MNGYYNGNDTGDFYNHQLTPWEKCRNLLLEYRREQKSRHRDIDKMVLLSSKISQFPVATITGAFDNIVDTCGW